MGQSIICIRQLLIDDVIITDTVGRDLCCLLSFASALLSGSSLGPRLHPVRICKKHEEINFMKNSSHFFYHFSLFGVGLKGFGVKYFCGFIF